MGRNHRLVEGEWYHCYNRGVEKRSTFLDAADYRRFLWLAYTCNSSERFENLTHRHQPLEEVIESGKREEPQLVSIGAYCLMPNHFHILLRQEEENGIARFMQKVLTGYTMYFNKRRERTGPLFAGVFKSRHVDNDRYLQWVTSYIHFNPSKIVTSMREVKEFKYSSYRDFLTPESRPERHILSPEIFELVNQGLAADSLKALAGEYDAGMGKW